MGLNILQMSGKKELLSIGTVLLMFLMRSVPGADPQAPPQGRPFPNDEASLGQGEPSFGMGLMYSSFLGDSQDDHAAAMKIGADGSKYVVGETYSPQFPTTAGAFDTSFNGGADVFVSRISPDGSTLLYSTFLGGGGVDLGSSLAVGPDGSAYIGGTTY